MWQHWVGWPRRSATAPLKDRQASLWMVLRSIVSTQENPRQQWARADNGVALAVWREATRRHGKPRHGAALRRTYHRWNGGGGKGDVLRWQLRCCRPHRSDDSHYRKLVWLVLHCRPKSLDFAPYCRLPWETPWKARVPHFVQPGARQKTLSLPLKRAPPDAAYFSTFVTTAEWPKETRWSEQDSSYVIQVFITHSGSPYRLTYAVFCRLYWRVERIRGKSF